MSIADNAIQRLQTLALAITSEKIRGAPSYPVEDASVLPLSIAYWGSGSGQADEATTVRMLINAKVDFHVSTISLKSAYSQINNIIPEYIQRLAGDPTLNGTVDTIVFPVTFEVNPAMWSKVTTLMASFTVPLKFRESPTT